MKKVFGRRGKAVLIGSMEDMSRLWSDMEMGGCKSYVLGIFTDDDACSVPSSLKVLGSLDEATSCLDGETAVTDVFCSPERLTEEAAETIFRNCEDKGVRLCALPPRINSYGRNWRIATAGYTSVLVAGGEPLRSFGGRLVKRTFDILVSALVLLTVLPVVTVVAAALTKRKGGPVLSAIKRKGAHGKAFREYSFGIFGNGVWAGLPRFINVLRGSLSVVGPRESVRPWVKPGMTGMARVLGYEAGGAYESRVDVWYVENWTLWLDLKVLAHRI